MRQIDCTQYSDCLNSAAHRNRNFSCAGCERYENPDPLLSGIEQEIDPEARRAGHLAGLKEEPMSGNCRISGCEWKPKVRGLCRSHYDKWRTGDEEVAKLMGHPFKVIRSRKPGKPDRSAPTDLSDPSVIAPGSQVIHKLIEKASAHVNGRAEALANEHWAYVRDLLEVHGQEELYKIEFHYKSAMIHGYKHGVADRERTASS